jgi:hypothetical protein
MDSAGARSKPKMRENCLRNLLNAGLLPCLLGLGTVSGYARLSKPYVEAALSQPSRDVPSRQYQLQEFLLKRIPQLPIVPFRSAPELFCLDFYLYFDIDNLSTLAALGKIVALNSLR